MEETTTTTSIEKYDPQEKEMGGFNTINNTLYKMSNALLVVSILPILGFLVGTGAAYLFFPNVYLEIIGIIFTFFSILIFAVLFMTTKSSVKRTDTIIFRKFRAGAATISKANLKGKSYLYFDRKDQASKVLISWAGAVTDPVSGCKIIQISEGHPTNDNLNAQVSESEWDKDVSRLTKAKSVADLAEAELFNQGLLGLKWQDIALIIIALVSVVTLVYLIAGAPDAIAKKTIEGLMNGNIQNALTTAIQNSGLLGNPVPVQ
jgi:hypothetical protein